MFKMTIRTDNDAFGDSAWENREEVARILRNVADALENGTSAAPLHDCNGNTCGRFDMNAEG